MRASIEVADIFCSPGPAYRAAHAGHLSLHQLKIMSAVEHCRTAAMGGHVEACQDCGHWRIAYNRCRNRHCPKCQGAAARTWLAEREADLLPVGYFPVVFTLPAEVATIALHNKALVYDLLFRAASATMTTIAADPKHRGARIGITAVLHTWGSALTHHPHIHMIVPGGGLSLDGTRWISSRAAFLRHLAPVRKKRWVVYAKAPFAGPEAVLAYLARYTHRVAISNSRLVRFDETGVTFRYKDYRKGGADRQQVMTLAADAFIQRFLLHTLPRGFHRIRHYGLLASGNRQANLERIRQLLEVAPPADDSPVEPADVRPPCPYCAGQMVIIATFERRYLPRAPPSCASSPGRQAP
jgi:hypothetical protein